MFCHTTHLHIVPSQHDAGVTPCAISNAVLVAIGKVWNIHNARLCDGHPQKCVEMSTESAGPEEDVIIRSQTRGERVQSEIKESGSASGGCYEEPMRGGEERREPPSRPSISLSLLFCSARHIAAAAAPGHRPIDKRSRDQITNTRSQITNTKKKKWLLERERKNKRRHFIQDSFVRVIGRPRGGRRPTVASS
ncbi:hypothetical protein EYF80_001342 [Liparis tanakae]|uniref:Uncharacterized protein n=1 Tax=Liparis tanakae TaxID=230148 RepID=A0A4Z2JE95_9TELE|nr:hypothetical protein EYF80_001342 [Liparis tanakae]